MRGESPSTPDIVGLELEELHALRIAQPLAALLPYGCGIGCGVHGFAMNPCNSRPLSTAPYYREARVTSEQRQTACEIAALLALAALWSAPVNGY